jgi:hypothetical protein
VNNGAKLLLILRMGGESWNVWCIVSEVGTWFEMIRTSSVPNTKESNGHIRNFYFVAPSRDAVSVFTSISLLHTPTVFNASNWNNFGEPYVHTYER